ncbi:MAG: pyridoxamine 5'-phosphate oxidase family protein [Phycisphaerales bacterium]|nr:pyridoxamine 5'-phosphate oxidase family protein [Hyphomonadaceae bacterium]
MPSESEIKSKFWKTLKSDRTIMLGVEGSGEARPMTAQVEGDDERGPIWFFGSKDTDLVQQIGEGSAGVGYFAAKDHNLFAGVNGELTLVSDRATIDRLWNPFVAAWYEGKDDPKLQLIRFDPEHAHIWLNESSVFAGIKMLLGKDPKKEYGDKVADVPLS